VRGAVAVRAFRSTVVATLALAFLLPATSVEAAAVFDAIASSSDTTVDLSGSVASDEDVAEDDLAVVTAPVGPPGIPVAADLSAYHRLANDELFAVDTTILLPGGIAAEPLDVVRWNGAVYTIEFSGAANGIPTGVRIDAITVEEDSGDLLLSFDVDLDLGGLVAADEDLVAFGGGGFSGFFDGSAAGLAEALDVDAAQAIGSASLALSFDVSGEIGGVSFDDEDVLEYDRDSGSWQMLFDGSAQHPGWTGAGLDALHLVPEPGRLVSLVAGLGLLGVLGRRRGCCARRPQR